MSRPGSRWICPFSFCPRFGTSFSSSGALRGHVSWHLKRSSRECLSGRGRVELVEHLRDDGRWLCSRCDRTYKLGSRCHGCGSAFSGSEDFPVLMPLGSEAPVLGVVAVEQVVQAHSVGFSDVFSPMDEDPDVFKILRCANIPTLSFIPKACRRGVAKCYADAVKAVNEDPGDLNRWGIMQIFIVSVLRSVGKEDRGAPL